MKDDSWIPDWLRTVAAAVIVLVLWPWLDDEDDGIGGAR